MRLNKQHVAKHAAQDIMYLLLGNNKTNPDKTPKQYYCYVQLALLVASYLTDLANIIYIQCSIKACRIQ